LRAIAGIAERSGTPALVFLDHGERRQLGARLWIGRDDLSQDSFRFTEQSE